MGDIFWGEITSKECPECGYLNLMREECMKCGTKMEAENPDFDRTTRDAE